jgi:hypothetical protein
MNRMARPWRTFFLLAGVLATGCGGGPSTNKDKTGASAGKEKYLLTEEPSGAKGVIDARKDARDGDDVVVVGRIGGDVKPWVEGRAAFWIVDGSATSCKEMPGDSCPTPWDYCCVPKEDLVKVMATVKVVDGNGETVKIDARELLGLKELQTVVVQGRAKRDEQGNLTVLAAAVFVRPDDKK